MLLSGVQQRLAGEGYSLLFFPSSASSSKENVREQLRHSAGCDGYILFSTGFCPMDHILLNIRELQDTGKPFATLNVPKVPELINQICYQVMGYDAVVSMAAEASELELCMAEPIIAYDLLHGMMILKNGCVTLSSRCVEGIEANRDVCRGYVEKSIGLITALVPVIGYEQSAAIAKEALKTGQSVYELVLEKGVLSQEQLDDMLKPENMTDPREIPKK